ncbi:MAG: radical SAM protein [Patescibacteria group bacterium]
MYKGLVGPLSVQIEITDNCNESCGHCYRSCQLTQNDKTVTLCPVDAITIVDRVADGGVSAVAFTGGEPLLYQKTVIPAIRRSKERGLVCNVNTNLQPLTDGVVDVFAELDVRVLTSIVSADAFLHDAVVSLPRAHERLIRNIRKLTERGVKVSANMVVRKDNAHKVYETGILVHSLGVRRFSATKAAPTPGINYSSYAPSREQLKDSLDALLRLKEELGIKVDILESYPLCFFKDLEKYKVFIRRNCTAGVFNCSISPNGDVRPCSHADMRYGNVLSESLGVCWRRMSDWREGRYINDDCRGCPYLYECTGGCRTDAKTLTGDIRGKDPLMGRWEDIIPSPPKEDAFVELPERMHLDVRTFLRKESFGGIIKLDDDIVFLSQEASSIVVHLRVVGKFTLDDLSGFPVPEGEKEALIALLFEKGMIVAE